MKLYEVYIREVWTRTYRVEAESEEAARIAAQQIIEEDCEESDEFEYSHTLNEEFGVEEFQEYIPPRCENDHDSDGSDELDYEGEHYKILAEE